MAAGPVKGDPATRPRPAASRDGAFFWEGCEKDRLLAQRCAGCGALRHPPRPMCPRCQSLERAEVELSGRGSLHAWCRPVLPQLPMFEPGYIVALVDLDEGIRMLSNLCGVAAGDIEVGMRLEVFFVDTADGGRVHQFRPEQGEPE